VRGQYVVIEAGGAVRTLMWDAIAEVIVTKETEERLSHPAPKGGLVGATTSIVSNMPAGTGAANTGKPLKLAKKNSKKKIIKTTTTNALNVNKEGAAFTHTVKCTTNDDPTCKEQLAVNVNKDGPKVTYSSETDCAHQPGGVCKDTRELGISKAGFGASATHEEAVAIDDNKRPSSAQTFSMTALVGFDVGSSAQIFITNLDANYKILTGGKFPGKAGGNWFGFAAEPTVGFVLLAFSGFGMTSTGTGFRIGSSAGLEVLHFGKLDDKNLKQGGIGGFLGLYAGYQAVSVGGGDSSGDFQIGPQLELVFPSYNAGTAKFKSQSVNFMVLPTGDSVFISLGYATSF
jgi:hypothetical protein